MVALFNIFGKYEKYIDIDLDGHDKDVKFLGNIHNKVMKRCE